MKPKINQLINKSVIQLKRGSPTILTCLGVAGLDGGEYVGWNCDDGIYWIDFNHRKTVLDDGLEVYIIEMVWTPDTNWCDEEDFTME